MVVSLLQSLLQNCSHKQPVARNFLPTEKRHFMQQIRFHCDNVQVTNGCPPMSLVLVKEGQQLSQTISPRQVITADKQVEFSGVQLTAEPRSSYSRGHIPVKQIDWSIIYI